jgi:hypothetical protein
MNTKVNVHLLPTNKHSKICYLTAKGKEFKDLRLLEIEVPIIIDSENFHLYLTIPQSDLEISKTKEDDYYIFKNNVFTLKHGDKLRPNCEKVIATTDSSLFDYMGDFDYYKNHNIVKIPQSFIEGYIEEYNKGHIIDSVEVELEDNNYNIGCSEFHRENYYKQNLKLTPNNEVIVVQPEEKMYSKDEVKELCAKAIADTINNMIEYLANKSDIPFGNQWIKIL